MSSGELNDIQNIQTKNILDLPFDSFRCAPDREGVKDCCKTKGNLDWVNNGEGRYVGTCKTCGCRHFVVSLKKILN